MIAQAVLSGSILKGGDYCKGMDMHTIPYALTLAIACISSVNLAQSAPLGGIVTNLSCTMRAYDRCAGDFCYDSKHGQSDGTTGVAGVSSWAFNFDFRTNTASVGDEYANNRDKRWPIKAVEVSPAIVNKPMFVKFAVRTDTTKLNVMIVATPGREGEGYSFGFGVVSRRPYGVQPIPGIDKTINSGDCEAE